MIAAACSASCLVAGCGPLARSMRCRPCLAVNIQVGWSLSRFPSTVAVPATQFCFRRLPLHMVSFSSVPTIGFLHLYGSQLPKELVMVDRVVVLSSGDRVRLFRSRDAVAVQLDLVAVDDFVEGGKCLVLWLSEAVALRDGLSDLLDGPRQPVVTDFGSVLPARSRRTGQ